MTNKETLKRVFDMLTSQKFADWYNEGHFYEFISGGDKDTHLTIEELKERAENDLKKMLRFE
jgi:hypothetical protein